MFVYVVVFVVHISQSISLSATLGEVTLELVRHASGHSFVLVLEKQKIHDQERDEDSHTGHGDNQDRRESLVFLRIRL